LHAAPVLHGQRPPGRLRPGLPVGPLLRQPHGLPLGGAAIPSRYSQPDDVVNEQSTHEHRPLTAHAHAP
jgi:hypothetical protein